MQLQVIFLCGILTLFSVCCDAEYEIIPDFRKVQWINGEDVKTGYPNDEYAYQRLPDYVKERARLYRQYHNNNNQHDNRPAFYYRFPDHPPATNSKSPRPFAVDPSDPRYYLNLKTPIIPDYNSELLNSKIDDEETDDDTLIDDTNQDDDTNDNNIDNDLTSSNNKQLSNNNQQQSPTHQRKLYNGDFVRGSDANGVRIVPATISVDREKEAVGLYVIAIVAGISAAATVGLIVFGFGYYNLQKNAKAAADVEYPAYGVTGPHKDVSPSGDRRLAQSAHMYHYQHQKQQIIAMERAANERHGSMSEADTDEENEEGDYTVYECPGLAPTGEMEVKNPLFQDDPTPATGPANEKSPEPIGDTPDLK